MATVSSPATLSSVVSVFGGGNNFSAYNRGGSYVKNINAYSGVSTSGHSLSQFSGLVNPVISIPISSAVHGVGAGTATATLSYSSAGTATGTGYGSGTWLLSGSAGNYEIMFNRVTGSTPTGASVNTWLALSSTRSWTLTQSTTGSKTCDGYIAIRDTLNSVELSNVAMYMEATSG